MRMWTTPRRAIGGSPARLPVTDGNVLKLHDGSLRAVIECRATAARLLDLLGTLPHPAQIVVRARRPVITDRMPTWRRLRASHAMLISHLSGTDVAFERRVMVTIPCDASASGNGPALLAVRVADVCERLYRDNLDPVQLSGPDLDEVALLDVAHEGRCEVYCGDLLARTLIVTRLSDQLLDGTVDVLDCEHDLSVHFQPTGRHGLIDLGAYVTLWAGTRVALDAATERAEVLLASHGVRLRRPYLLAEPALVAATPVGLDPVRATRVLPSRRSDCHGKSEVLYGADPASGRPLMLDRFSLPNPNALVLGDAPSRLRMLTQELVRARMTGVEVHVIDGTGGYARIVRALDGRVVAPIGFDALSVPPPSIGGLESRIGTLSTLVELMAGDLEPIARDAVVDAVAFAYAARGNTHDGAGDQCDPPTLDAIVAALDRRGAAARVVRALERYVAGGGRQLLERRSSSLRLGRLSIHDLTSLPHEDRPAAALLSLDRLWRETSADRRSLVLMDGVDPLLDGVAGQHLSELIARASALHTGLTVATSDVAAVLRVRLREAALAAGLVVLLPQERPALELLAEAFRLTPAEQSWLLRAHTDEGLLIARGRRVAFRAVASDEEERLITGGATR